MQPITPAGPVKKRPPMYVVAVSGGVDSIALLDILHKRNDARLLVAHYDHGIREDSAADRQFVEAEAGRRNVAFAYDEGRLGAGASEAEARDARYAFLRRLKQASGARAIVTAHHEDDVFETALLNLLRGTGRKGLSSLGNTDEVYRPLLETSKRSLQAYARANGLVWREDSTNTQNDYLRNYIRHQIMPYFDESSRQHLREIIAHARQGNLRIDEMLADQLHLQPAHNLLDRHWFIMLPHVVAREIIAAWLRAHGVRGFDAGLLEHLVVAIKTFAPGKQIDVDANFFVLVRADDVLLLPRGRYAPESTPPAPFLPQA